MEKLDSFESGLPTSGGGNQEAVDIRSQPLGQLYCPWILLVLFRSFEAYVNIIQLLYNLYLLSVRLSPNNAVCLPVYTNPNTFI